MKESMLTTDQLAKVLGVHIVTVQRMVKQGRIPAIRVGSGYRFDMSKVLEALAVNPTSGDRADDRVLIQ